MRRNGPIQCLVLIVVGGVPCAPGVSAKSQETESEKAIKVKAAYLLNFAKFVTWPAGAFRDEKSPIVLGVVGVDPFGPILDQTIKDKVVSGRALTLKRFDWREGDDISALKQCHLLYISASLGNATSCLMATLARTPIVLVGEGAEFVTLGGTLAFMMEEGRIVFCANRKAADRAGIELSSQLLKLARPLPDEDDTRAADATKKSKGD